MACGFSEDAAALSTIDTMYLLKHIISRELLEAGQSGLS
jgi:hypothetical protein